MTLTEIRTKVRRDLKDEDPANYRWSDDEIDRQINHALLDISQAIPQQRKSTGIVIPTPASKDIDISSIIPGLILVDAAEYPVDQDPKRFRQFSLWRTTLSLLISETPIAAAAVNIYYSAVHALDQLVTTVWAATTAYVVGDLRIPTPGNETGFNYRCTTAGTSGASEPSWPIVPGTSIIDGTAVWTCTGGSTLPSHLEDLCAVGAGAYAAIEWAAYSINQLNVGGAPTPTEYLKWAQDRMDFYQKELKRYGRQSRLKIARLYAD